MPGSSSSETVADVSLHPEQAWTVESRLSTHGQDRSAAADDNDHHQGHENVNKEKEDTTVVIDWERHDPENPHNWTTGKKILITFAAVLPVLNATMGSAIPSMAVPKITAEFAVTDPQQDVLPISIFLIGSVLGPIVWGPLSEHFGRRWLTLLTSLAFTLFSLLCALAPSWPALLVFRLCCGIFAGASIALVAGTLADIFEDPRTRGKAYSVYMVICVLGPLFAPILSGFTAPTIGWHWSFRIGHIISAASLLVLVFMPETYAPVLLARRARRMRERERERHHRPQVPATDPGARRLDDKHSASVSASTSTPRPPRNFVAPRDLEPTKLARLFRVVLTRPLRMLFRGPTVSATCAYLALVYAIFYMSFQAFPIIFQQLYHLSPGVTGLCYLPIGAGACLSMPLFWYWDARLARARARGAPWTDREEFHRVPLACCGGPVFVVSLFWLGFTARASVPFVVPMLAGVLFGLGFMLISMALNYLTDAYEVYAASANAAASCSRSLLAVVLPLTTTPMFTKLGISGACALLGGISTAMCLIPFVFI